MSKVKVLLFIDWYLPGYRAGGPIRSMANMVATLKDAIDFTIVTRDRDYKSDEPYANCGIDFPQRVEGATVYYLKPEEMTLATYRKLAKKLTYSILYINGMYSFWFSILPLLLFQSKHTKTIVSPRGMLSSGSIGVKSMQKRLYLTLARYGGVYSKVAFHCSTPEEEQDTQQVFGRKVNTTSITNFSKALSPIKHIAAPQEIGLQLFQIARISPEKNQLKALELLLQVKHPVTFDLYGPLYNEAYWGKCLALINQLPTHVHVRWHGAIAPEYIEETIAAHHALFLPTTGENFGHIIAETLSAGRPVVISNTTPWQNLQVQHAGYSLSLDADAQFVAAIKALAGMSSIDYETWCQSAQVYYQRQTQTAAIRAAYLSLFSA